MREQFPLKKVSFDMTINKSQALLLTKVNLDLKSSVFMHGQLYVVMSRVTSAQGMTIFLPTNNPQTENGVYSEVLYRETT
ncbi:DNA repair and recombination protein PIF1-like [Mucor ambiguus]|uniref:DNA repair and recombination protein PIF1-like n=1 Tax=Mucor ambiguus TaxID=91626 RepID=A0A0C9M0D1_9FUNG|nr:DNA repair and recombination protein PIF1-like [Mucor ambiguus]